MTTYAGNIDIKKKPRIKNKDGSVSTLKSISFKNEKTGKETLIPSIVEGKELSPENAIQHYYKTGEHLGEFDTIEEATNEAKRLSDLQVTPPAIDMSDVEIEEATPAIDMSDVDIEEAPTYKIDMSDVVIEEAPNIAFTSPVDLVLPESDFDYNKAEFADGSDKFTHDKENYPKKSRLEIEREELDYSIAVGHRKYFSDAFKKEISDTVGVALIPVGAAAASILTSVSEIGNVGFWERLSKTAELKTHSNVLKREELLYSSNDEGFVGFGVPPYKDPHIDRIVRLQEELSKVEDKYVDEFVGIRFLRKLREVANEWSEEVGRLGSVRRDDLEYAFGEKLGSKLDIAAYIVDMGAQLYVPLKVFKTIGASKLSPTMKLLTTQSCVMATTPGSPEEKLMAGIRIALFQGVNIVGAKLPIGRIGVRAFDFLADVMISSPYLIRIAKLNSMTEDERIEKYGLEYSDQGINRMFWGEVFFSLVYSGASKYAQDSPTFYRRMLRDGKAVMSKLNWEQCETELKRLNKTGEIRAYDKNGLPLERVWKKIIGKKELPDVQRDAAGVPIKSDIVKLDMSKLSAEIKAQKLYQAQSFIIGKYIMKQAAEVATKSELTMREFIYDTKNALRKQRKRMKQPKVIEGSIDPGVGLKVRSLIDRINDANLPGKDKELLKAFMQDAGWIGREGGELIDLRQVDTVESSLRNSIKNYESTHLLKKQAKHLRKEHKIPQSNLDKVGVERLMNYYFDLLKMQPHFVMSGRDKVVVASAAKSRQLISTYEQHLSDGTITPHHFLLMQKALGISTLHYKDPKNYLSQTNASELADMMHKMAPSIAEEVRLHEALMKDASLAMEYAKLSFHTDGLIDREWNGFGTLSGRWMSTLGYFERIGEKTGLPIGRTVNKILNARREVEWRAKEAERQMIEIVGNKLWPKISDNKQWWIEIRDFRVESDAAKKAKLGKNLTSAQHRVAEFLTNSYKAMEETVAVQRFFQYRQRIKDGSGGRTLLELLELGSSEESVLHHLPGGVTVKQWLQASSAWESEGEVGLRKSIQENPDGWMRQLYSPTIKNPSPKIRSSNYAASKINVGVLLSRTYDNKAGTDQAISPKDLWLRYVNDTLVREFIAPHTELFRLQIDEATWFVSQKSIERAWTITEAAQDFIMTARGHKHHTDAAGAWLKYLAKKSAPQVFLHPWKSLRNLTQPIFHDQFHKLFRAKKFTPKESEFFNRFVPMNIKEDVMFQSGKIGKVAAFETKINLYALTDTIDRLAGFKMSINGWDDAFKGVDLKDPIAFKDALNETVYPLLRESSQKYVMEEYATGGPERARLVLAQLYSDMIFFNYKPAGRGPAEMSATGEVIAKLTVFPRQWIEHFRNFVSGMMKKNVPMETRIKRATGLIKFNFGSRLVGEFIGTMTGMPNPYAAERLFPFTLGGLGGTILQKARMTFAPIVESIVDGDVKKFGIVIKGLSTLTDMLIPFKQVGIDIIESILSVKNADLMAMKELRAVYFDVVKGDPSHYTHKEDYKQERNWRWFLAHMVSGGEKEAVITDSLDKLHSLGKHYKSEYIRAVIDGKHKKALKINKFTKDTFGVSIKSVIKDSDILSAYRRTLTKDMNEFIKQYNMESWAVQVNWKRQQKRNCELTDDEYKTLIQSFNMILDKEEGL